MTVRVTNEDETSPWGEARRRGPFNAHSSPEGARSGWTKKSTCSFAQDRGYFHPSSPCARNPPFFGGIAASSAPGRRPKQAATTYPGGAGLPSSRCTDCRRSLPWGRSLRKLRAEFLGMLILSDSVNQC